MQEPKRTRFCSMTNHFDFTRLLHLSISSTLCIDMKIVQVALILFLLFLSVHAKNHCPTSYCGNNNTIPIQYPFKLEHESPITDCSYINLTCSSLGIPILNLPYLGDFYVRHIYYDYSVVELYDPENCLPKRFMTSDPYDLYPFLPIFYQNFTFYSCPLELTILANLTIIDCLSNSFFATVATNTVSSQVMTELYRCNEIVTSLVPARKRDTYGFIENESAIFLQWFMPLCNVCPRTRGILTEELLPIAYILLTFMPLLMPTLICIACCATCTKTLREEMKLKRANSLA